MIRTAARRYLQRSTSSADQHDASRPRSLRYNVAWTTVGNIVYAASQWGMLVVLAKLGSPEMVGQFTLGLAITAPVMLFASLKLRAVQATDARQEYRFGDYLGLRLLTTTLALLIILTFVIIAGYQYETTMVVIMVALSKVFDAFSDIVYGLLQQHERMDRVAISRMIQGVLQVVTLGVVVALTRSVLWGTVGIAIASGIVTLAYDVQSAVLTVRSGTKIPSGLKANIEASYNHLRPCWNLSVLVKLTMLSVPLGLAIMLGSLWTNVPRYFIQHSFGERELGIFAAIGYLMVVGSTLVNALAQSASPRLARYYVSRDWGAFDALVLRLISLGAMLGGIGFIITLIGGNQILASLYSPEYAHHTNVLIWLMAAFAMQYSYVFFGTAINAMRDFKVQLPIQGASCLIVLVSCFYFIDRYGLLGAAWAMLAANTFEAVAYTSYFLRKRSIKSFSVV